MIDPPDISISRSPSVGPTFSIEGPKPILRWHPAKAGVLEETSGILDRMFPALKELSDKELEDILQRKRKRGV